MKQLKKPVFKKNQMIITALAAMIAVAGYLNYSGTRLDESLLSANSTAVEDVEEGNLAEDILAEENVGETVLASSTMGVGLVSEAKVTREQTRSRNKEMLMELINSANITEEQKQNAINEMVKMTDVAEKELAAETLLVAQGFDEVVVSINDACADVVVSSTQVSDSQRAQIEDIVKRKTGIEAANITITPVKASE